MSVKNIYLNNVVLKTTKGAELIEANGIHLKNIQLLSEKTNPLIYVENGHDIELNSIKYAANPQRFLSINGEKSGNIILTDTEVPKSNNSVEFNHGATSTMLTETS